MGFILCRCSSVVESVELYLSFFFTHSPYSYVMFSMTRVVSTQNRGDNMLMFVAMEESWVLSSGHNVTEGNVTSFFKGI